MRFTASRAVAVVAIGGLGMLGCGSAGAPTTYDTASNTAATTTNAGATGANSSPSTDVVGAAAVDACPGNASFVASVEPSTGQSAWRWCSDPPSQVSLSGATDELVYVTVDRHAIDQQQVQTWTTRLVALDATNGDQRWDIDVPVLNDGVHHDALDAPGPFATDGVIVLDILDGSDVWHIGYDAKTGEELWRKPAGEAAVVANTDAAAILGDLYLGEGLGPEIDPPRGH
jgi:outer membrane protein assembly factor BamB